MTRLHDHIGDCLPASAACSDRLQLPREPSSKWAAKWSGEAQAVALAVPLTGGRSVEKCAWECFCEGAKSRPVVVPHIGIRPMDSAAAPATRSPMLSPPVAIATPLKNKPATPAAATGLKPSCGVLCEIFSRFSLTIPRWLFTSSIRRSEPGKPRSRGRHHRAGSARSRGVQWSRSGLLVVDGLSAEARPPIVRGFQAVR